MRIFMSRQWLGGGFGLAPRCLWVSSVGNLMDFSVSVLWLDIHTHFFRHLLGTLYILFLFHVFVLPGRSWLSFNTWNLITHKCLGSQIGQIDGKLWRLCECRGISGKNG